MPVLVLGFLKSLMNRATKLTTACIGKRRQGETHLSSLIYWRVSPPVTLETGIQFPDGEAVLNLLYCFGPDFSRRKAKRRAICIGRESNRTLKTRERVRFHRDLNSDRWIQSPERSEAHTSEL